MADKKLHAGDFIPEGPWKLAGELSPSPTTGGTQAGELLQAPAARDETMHLSSDKTASEAQRSDSLNASSRKAAKPPFLIEEIDSAAAQVQARLLRKAGGSRTGASLQSKRKRHGQHEPGPFARGQSNRSVAGQGGRRASSGQLRAALSPGRAHPFTRQASARTLASDDGEGDGDGDVSSIDCSDDDEDPHAARNGLGRDRSPRGAGQGRTGGGAGARRRGGGRSRSRSGSSHASGATGSPQSGTSLRRSTRSHSSHSPTQSPTGAARATSSDASSPSSGSPGTRCSRTGARSPLRRQAQTINGRKGTPQAADSVDSTQGT